MANTSNATIKINSILSGQSPTQYLGADGTFITSIAIDPDMAVGSDTKTSGMMVPVRYEKFSGTEIDGFPQWIVTNTKTANSFISTSTGKLHSFDSSLAMRATDEAGTSFPITQTGGAGNGMVYYNNFLYIMEATDITQYGGMDQGASIAETENVWTGAKFGKTALNNATYPSLRGTPIPNHSGHVHGDNAAYFCDTLNGQGIIHKIKTSKTTIEGDTNNGSAYNALDLPFGYYPTDIESYDRDLVIAAFQGNSAVINQGPAALFFWDPTDTTSFYRKVDLPDPLVTALLNVNGIIYIWSGNAVNGVRVSRYLGGDTIDEIAYIEEGTPPFAGAVCANGNRIMWGSWTTYPIASASVMAFGSKRADLPKGLHNIAKSTSAGSTPTVTSLAMVQHSSSIQPKMVIGWGDGSAKGLDKIGTSAAFPSVIRSKMYNIGKRFSIEKIRIPLGSAIDANTTITAKVYLDDASSSVTLPTINNTNYPSKRKILYKNADLSGCDAENNFFIEFIWSGTTGTPITVPIVIDIVMYDDEPA